MTPQKWGAIASFTLEIALVAAPAIYLLEGLRDAIGQPAYHVADFLFGPVVAASLVTAVLALRKYIGDRASRRMTLALQAATLSAGMFVVASLLRSTNREYLTIHADLETTVSDTIFRAWSTVVPGVISSGWHFMGWALVLLGSVGWTTRQFPRMLSVLYLVAGVLSLFVYLMPDLEETIVLLSAVWASWQGILLWRAKSEEARAA